MCGEFGNLLQYSVQSPISHHHTQYLLCIWTLGIITWWKMPLIQHILPNGWCQVLALQLWTDLIKYFLPRVCQQAECGNRHRSPFIHGYINWWWDKEEHPLQTTCKLCQTPAGDSISLSSGHSHPTTTNLFRLQAIIGEFGLVTMYKVSKGGTGGVMGEQRGPCLASSSLALVLSTAWGQPNI